MKRLRLALIIKMVLYAIICNVICVAVSVLSGEMERWKKLIILVITFGILFPLVRYIEKYRKQK